jgi:hypothetical protein
MKLPSTSTWYQVPATVSRTTLKLVKTVILYFYDVITVELQTTSTHTHIMTVPGRPATCMLRVTAHIITFLLFIFHTLPGTAPFVLLI